MHCYRLERKLTFYETAVHYTIAHSDFSRSWTFSDSYMHFHLHLVKFHAWSRDTNSSQFHMKLNYANKTFNFILLMLYTGLNVCWSMKIRPAVQFSNITKSFWYEDSAWFEMESIGYTSNYLTIRQGWSTHLSGLSFSTRTQRANTTCVHAHLLHLPCTKTIIFTSSHLCMS